MTRLALALALSSVWLAPATLAQDPNPDVTVFEIGNFNLYGEAGGKYAYSFRTTSCNEGNVPVPWVNPVGGRVNIATNLFRFREGRVEQLGYGWIKLGFCALSEDGCGTCEATPCQTLGVGCADTYGFVLNDGQFGHGKADVNPTTGQHVQSLTSPSGAGLLTGRLQVLTTEMDQPEDTYFAEAQYVVSEDAKYDNTRNNNTWRELNNPTPGNLNGAGHPHMKGECAVEAWKTFDAGVTTVDLVNNREPSATLGEKGYYVLGYKATDLGGGQWRYEYAVQNLTSDQQGASFSLPLACEGVTVTDVFFRDVEHHSGSPFSNTDWTFTMGGGQLKWEVTETFAQNPNANALHWAELFNFGFTADAPPAQTVARLGLFKPGPLSCLTATVDGPCGTGPCGTSSYCMAVINSTGSAAAISAAGSTSICANDFTLSSGPQPAGFAGVFFYGPEQAQMMLGKGFLCIGGGLFRLYPPIVSDVTGTATRHIDFGPLAGTAGAITPGSTWNFQYWFRDPQAHVTSFIFSDALTATFCP